MLRPFGLELATGQAFRRIACAVAGLHVGTVPYQRLQDFAALEERRVHRRVWPARLRWFGSQRVASSRFAMLSSPLNIAPISAVLPRLSAAHGSAPARSSQSTVAAWPW